VRTGKRRFRVLLGYYQIGKIRVKIPRQRESQGKVT